MLKDSGRKGLFAAFLTMRALANPVAFGASGAILDEKGRVLLVRQTYMPGWRLPGGGVGRGEPPDMAVMRELHEEVGLTGGTASLFGLYTAKAGLATHLVALYQITGGSIAFRPNWEVGEILFTDPAAPPPGTIGATRRRLAELCGLQKTSQYW